VVLGTVAALTPHRFMAAPSRLLPQHPAAQGQAPGQATGLGALQRLAALLLALVLSLTVSACSGAKASAPASLSPETISAITKQAEGFLAARDRLPDLAALVNARDWTFTRNLIHGPMQEVGREMLYINKLLLPADRPEAVERATKLKAAMADLDEAARLQDGEALRKAYIKVASGFGLYAQVLPQPVKEALKQV
jgi:photosystem II protein PsbQ